MMRSILIVIAVVAAVMGTAVFAGSAHENGHFSAGVPGDSKKPARVIKVSMREEGTKMLFEPSRLSVRKGEQIRFVLSNDGTESHEFILATTSENRTHAEMMKKHPHMKHEEPNAIRLTPFIEGEMIWKFNRRGTFEYACLIDGHYQAGMHGTIEVK